MDNRIASNSAEWDGIRRARMILTPAGWAFRGEGCIIENGGGGSLHWAKYGLHGTDEKTGPYVWITPDYDTENVERGVENSSHETRWAVGFYEASNHGEAYHYTDNQTIEQVVAALRDPPAPKGILRPRRYPRGERVRWTFDDSPEFEGVAEGTLWNGFDNVSVTPEERAKIVVWLINDGCDRETIDGIAALPVGADGLVSFGGGYATTIVGRV